MTYTTVKASRGKAHAAKERSVITVCGVFLDARAPARPQFAGPLTCGNCSKLLGFDVVDELQRAVREAQA